MRSVRVAIVTQDVIGERLAGPAMRALAIARSLSGDGHDVQVHSTTAATAPSELVVPGELTPGQAAVVARAADVVLVQGDVLQACPELGRGVGALVCDLYDPFQMEELVRGAGEAVAVRYGRTRNALSVLSGQLQRGDLFLCASERQRLFWLGHLDAAGRVNAATYEADPALADLLVVVPFGIGEVPPTRDGVGLRDRVQGLDESSRIALWGGGVYDWLDPLPLIEGVGKVLPDIPDLRLVFMGTAHPNPAVSASGMLGRARALTRSLGLEHAVLFHDGWVPYEERHNVLLDAEVGVSGHLPHVETMLAFRTRILDYLWAGLPVLTTAGDALGDLVDDAGLGAVVPPGDPGAVADGLRSLLLDDAAAAAAREAIAAIVPSLRWSAVLRPLRAFCADPHPAADRDDPLAQRLRAARAPGGDDRLARLRDLAVSARTVLAEEGPGGLAAKVRTRLRRRAR